MTKHIFVTGGVASSLGKGLTASSLGNLLKARALFEAAGWKLAPDGKLRNAQGEAFEVEYLEPSQPGRNTESEREIAVIMKAIRKRDGAAARKASVSHIEKATQAALKVLKAREAAEAQPAKAVRKRA